MKNLILLLMILSLFCPTAEAMKVYSYDSNGNRTYREVVSRYGAQNKHTIKSSTTKYVSEYDARGYNSRGIKPMDIPRLNNRQVYAPRTAPQMRGYSSSASRAYVRPSGAFYR